MIPAQIDRKMIPHKPGVYLFKNANGEIIYVGKAIDLYHRVSSYFSKYQGVHSTHIQCGLGGYLGKIDTKTVVLVDEIASVNTIIVESELEALILEANLIKKYLPQYNVRLTDDKDYLYIKITKEEFPKVITARKHELKGSLKYFGPFPSSRTVRDTLKALRKVFPWCQLGSRNLELGARKERFLDNGTTLETTNSRGSAVIAKTRRACFYYHLGLCSGPCAGMVDKKKYRKIIFRLAQLLEGKKDNLLDDINREMGQLSREQRFEEAARVKKTLNGLIYLTQPNRVQVYLENPNFVEDQTIKALKALKESLHLQDIPHRIECYDISNIQGKEATGSMVVLIEGEIDKSQYRKFKIKITGKPNDLAMHREMMIRRLKHSEWKKPDLVIIDGGQTQVNTVAPILHTTYYQLPVYGLAKRMEWLYSPDGSVVKLPRISSALKLLQKIRDEAHRFAISYHRKLHNKAILQTQNTNRKTQNYNLNSKSM